MDYDYSQTNFIEKKKYIDEIIDEEKRQIIVLEVRILSRQKALQTLPQDDPQTAIERERSEAEMGEFKDAIENKIHNIKMLEELAQK